MLLVATVSSEGAATTNSITAEESSLSPSARNLSREISEESETRLVHVLLTTFTHYDHLLI